MNYRNLNESFIYMQHLAVHVCICEGCMNVFFLRAVLLCSAFLLCAALWGLVRLCLEWIHHISFTSTQWEQGVLLCSLHFQNRIWKLKMPHDPGTNLYESISKQERNTLETREQKFGWLLGDISIYLPAFRNNMLLRLRWKREGNACLPC